MDRSIVRTFIDWSHGSALEKSDGKVFIFTKYLKLSKVMTSFFRKVVPSTVSRQVMNGASQGKRSLNIKEKFILLPSNAESIGPWIVTIQRSSNVSNNSNVGQTALKRTIIQGRESLLRDYWQYDLRFSWTPQYVGLRSRDGVVDSYFIGVWTKKIWNSDNTFFYLF